MSLKGKKKIFKTGADELEGGSVWGRGGSHNFISLGTPKVTIRPCRYLVTDKCYHIKLKSPLKLKCFINGETIENLLLYSSHWNLENKSDILR
jgi:hypothetical protein